MEILVRASVIYWFLWLVVRGTGKRSLSQMSPLDILLVVVIGDIVQQGVTQEDMSVTGAVLSVAVFVLWMLLGDWIARRSSAGERVLHGSPIYLLKAGQPLLETLHRERMTIEDLHSAAREKGYRTLDQISYAVLEPDGTFSFLPADTEQSSPQ